MCWYEKITETLIFNWQNVYNMIPFVAFFLKHFLMCKSDFWKEVPVEIIWSMGRDVNEAILSWWEDISIIYAKYKLLNVLHQALYAKTTIKENFLIVCTQGKTSPARW